MENILTGFHAVEERVKSVAEKGEKESAKKMRVLYDKAGPRIKKILSFAKDAGILCIKTTKEELDKKALSLSELARNHRGVMLVIEGEYTEEPLHRASEEAAALWERTVRSPLSALYRMEAPSADAAAEFCGQEEALRMRQIPHGFRSLRVLSEL